jgi:hypothetical protein
VGDITDAVWIPSYEGSEESHCIQGSAGGMGALGKKKLNGEPDEF